jgi:hypothetical protein
MFISAICYVQLLKEIVSGSFSLHVLLIFCCFGGKDALKMLVVLSLLTLTPMFLDFFHRYTFVGQAETFPGCVAFRTDP